MHFSCRATECHHCSVTCSARCHFSSKTPLLKWVGRGREVIGMKMGSFLLRSPELGRSAPKMQASDAAYERNPGLYSDIALDRFPARPYKPVSQTVAWAWVTTIMGGTSASSGDTKRAGIPPFGKQNEQNLVSRWGTEIYKNNEGGG